MNTFESSAVKDFPPTKTVVRTLITRMLFDPNFLNKHFFLWTTCRIISSESVVGAGLIFGTRNQRVSQRYNFICLQFVRLHRVKSSEYQMQIFILMSNEKKVLIISHQAENCYRIKYQNFSVTFCDFSCISDRSVFLLSRKYMVCCVQSFFAVGLFTWITFSRIMCMRLLVWLTGWWVGVWLFTFNLLIVAIFIWKMTPEAIDAVDCANRGNL